VIAEEGRGVVVLLRDTTMKLGAEWRGLAAHVAAIWAWGADSVIAGLVRIDPC
jgi:hypothetical protein